MTRRPDLHHTLTGVRAAEGDDWIADQIRRAEGDTAPQDLPMRPDDLARLAEYHAPREAEARAAQERSDAEARHQREIEEAQRRERERIEAEQRAADEAQRKREESTRIRNKVRREIIAAFEAMPIHASPESIADALIAGKIPHTKVTF